MKIYHGIGSSTGIAIGRALTISAFTHFPRIELDRDEDIEVEIGRFRHAQDLTETQIDETEMKTGHTLGEEMKTIFATYRLFIRDRRLVSTTENAIKAKKINAEWALIHTISEIESEFDKIEDSYIRARFSDIRQIGERIMNNLQNRPHLDLAGLRDPVILICADISPADAFHLTQGKILGIVSELGGETSHSSIIARALGIPAVVGVEEVLSKIQSDEQVIVDGSEGEIVHEPDEETFQTKLEKINQLQFFHDKLRHLKAADCQFADGQHVEIAANLDYLDELDEIQSLNIGSIGLVRTEFLFIDSKSPPTEQEQYELYSDIIKLARGKPVTIRTWDFGADKAAAFFPNVRGESNPALGLRAIRMCLEHREFFQDQIRAIVRAAENGPLRVMVPLVTNLDEMMEAQSIIREEQTKLNVSQTRLKVGLMIETPASALLVEELLDICDFISIGSNDLVQYTLAIDRLNEHVSKLYSSFHPAVLRLLEKIVISANQAHVPVSICGEIAADPFMQMFLLGVGDITFSMSPNRVLVTKKVLSNLNAVECKKIAFQFLSKRTMEESAAYIETLRNIYLKDIPI